MKTDIFLLKIGKSCLSDAKTQYLIEEWYLENYGIDPAVIGHAVMWQVIWENCQGFIERFWSIKQVLELIQRDSFRQPSGDYHKDFVFRFFGKIATDRYIYDKVEEFYTDNIYDDKFGLGLDRQNEWIEQNLKQRDTICAYLDSKFNHGSYSYHQIEKVSMVSIGYVLRWADLYFLRSDGLTIGGGEITDWDNQVKYEAIYKCNGFVAIRFNFPNVLKYARHIRDQRIYLSYIFERK